jgi:hypothetical protein
MIGMLAAVAFDPEEVDPHQRPSAGRGVFSLGLRTSRAVGASSSGPLGSLWASTKLAFRVLGDLLWIGILTTGVFTLGGALWRMFFRPARHQLRGRRFPGPHLEVVK